MAAPRPHILGAQQPHLGLWVHCEAQQPLVHLQGHRVAPGLQVLLPQKGGQAGEDLQERFGVSQLHLLQPAGRRAQVLTNSKKSHGDPSEAHVVPIPLLGSIRAPARSAGLWKMAEGNQTQKLTHRRAEVEPLLVWAAMMSMKALEVSENFLMSTGLGTLWGKKRDGGTPRGVLQQQEQA